MQEDSLGTSGNPLYPVIFPPVGFLCLTVYNSFTVNTDVFYTDTGEDAGKAVILMSFPGTKDNTVFFLVCRQNRKLCPVCLAKKPGAFRKMQKEVVP